MKLKKMIHRIKAASDIVINAPDYPLVGNEWVIIEKLELEHCYYLGAHIHYPNDKRILIFYYDGKEIATAKVAKHLNMVIRDFFLYCRLLYKFSQELSERYKETEIPDGRYAQLIHDRIP